MFWYGGTTFPYEITTVATNFSDLGSGVGAFFAESSPLPSTANTRGSWLWFNFELLPTLILVPLL